VANRFFKFSFLLIALFLGGLTAQAQDAAQRFPTDPKPKEEIPKNIREMMSRKRIDQEKKEHEELLKKGQEAIEISDQLEQSFSQHNQLSAADKERLEYLAGLVRKIRREIGASDDDDDVDVVTDGSADDDKPSTLESAFKALQSTTVKLVDELKKTTRFTISAVAIKSSNSLLRIVRFIRSGK
jgi:hypothetical protein